MGLCPIPRERNFLKEVPLDSSRTFIGEKLRFSQRKCLASSAKNGVFRSSKVFENA